MSPYQEKLAAAKAERRRHIEAWRSSGLTQAFYAEAQGIHATTLNGWLRAAQRAVAAAATAAATANVKTTPTLTIRPVLVQSAARSPVSALPSPPPSPSPSMAAVPVAPMSPTLNATVPEQRITLTGLGGWRLSLAVDVGTTWLASLLRELDAAPKRAGTC